MAKMEHARWNVERLLNGWKWGEKRDVTKKVSPYLVPWSELSIDMKEWDRQTVRKIPEFLAKVGLEVHRQAYEAHHLTIGTDNSKITAEKAVCQREQ